MSNKTKFIIVAPLRLRTCVIVEEPNTNGGFGKYLFSTESNADLSGFLVSNGKTPLNFMQYIAVWWIGIDISK